MRLVYTADLHGDIDSYRALLELAVATGARAAIVGGDLLPHAIKLQSAIQIQRDFLTKRLRPLLVTFRERYPSIVVYLLAGNDDWSAAITALADLEQEELAYPLHERVYQLHASDERPLWLAGYACVPITPFSIKDYERRDDPAALRLRPSTTLGTGSGQASSGPDRPLPPISFSMAFTSWSGSIESIDAATLGKRPSIADDLDQLAQQSDPRRTIYVCHTPPADTALDQMPRGRHVGSRALRAFIERRWPLLTLHGHIHEAPDESGQFAIQLGDTWSINPGHNAQRFQAVALDTDDLAGTIEHTVYGRMKAE
jgi:Icc-related predicted phosphoesterase